MTFFIALLIFAQAEAGNNGGLKYTTINSQRTKEEGLLRHKSVQPEEETTEETKEDTPANKVWKKYKALAAGQYEDEPKKTESAEKPKEPEQAQKTEALQSAPPPTGFAAIIEKYNKNREQRSQLRSIQVTKPKPEDTNPE